MLGAQGVERLRGFLEERLPGLVVWEDRIGRNTHLIFPARQESEYRFVADVPDDLTHVTVAAELRADADLRFWRVHLRRAAADGSADVLMVRLEELLLDLLSAPTQVRQRRGRLFWTFTCARADPAGAPRLTGARVLRWLGRVPKLRGSERVYLAGPSLRRG
ncbi:MAG TPA: hypothetical protein VFQ38_14770 [Longimicrobiales bacterium]|nr:hypothetical protein [Longimicrobiales bacterium]